MEKATKILFVDHDENILQAAKRFLTQKGYDVIIASTGFAGLSRLQDENDTIDLLVTELIMPEVTGFGLLTLVKRDYPHIPVIAITGWGEIPEKLAKEMKTDIFMKKPFELDKLGGAIEDLLVTKSY